MVGFVVALLEGAGQWDSVSTMEAILDVSRGTGAIGLMRDERGSQVVFVIRRDWTEEVYVCG